MLWSLLTTLLVASIRGAATAASAGPSACVAFDVNWNLLAFGFNGKDYNAGTQDTWTGTGTPTDITASGRPPFNSANTTCYLSEFNNAIYVLNADTANPAAIYIYDATAKSWTMQSVTAGKFDPTNFAAILDHDTNFFYAFSGTDIYQLDISVSPKAATSAALAWADTQSPDLTADTTGAVTPGAGTAGYQPVMALAQNHVHFLGISGLPAGDAKIFVIHFSFMQPTPQNYGNFPSTHGKAASFFQVDGVQQEFAFIPDDGSATYVVNVETNTTKTLTGPPKADPFATYFASTSALVQLTTSGSVSFLAYNPNTTTSGGTWTPVSVLPSALGSSASGSGTSSGAAGSTSKGASAGSATGKGPAATGSSTSTSPSTSAKSSGMSLRMGGKSVGGLVLGIGMGLVGLGLVF